MQKNTHTHVEHTNTHTYKYTFAYKAKGSFGQWQARGKPCDVLAEQIDKRIEIAHKIDRNRAGNAQGGGAGIEGREGACYILHKSCSLIANEMHS